nr:MAG TPA: hypothetical protein [Caudoviricetes sp.]
MLVSITYFIINFILWIKRKNFLLSLLNRFLSLCYLSF